MFGDDGRISVLEKENISGKCLKEKKSKANNEEDMVGLGMMGEFLYLKRKIYLESVSNEGISKPYHILVDNSF